MITVMGKRMITVMDKRMITVMDKRMITVMGKCMKRETPTIVLLPFRHLDRMIMSEEFI